MTEEQRFQALNDAVQEVLRRQVDLEERLSRLENVSRAVQSAVPADPTAPPVAIPQQGPAAAPKQPSHFRKSDRSAAQQSERPAIETKVGLTLVNRIGVITLILGVGFFFKWAADNEWIGPTGRVLLGLLAGCVALAASEFLLRKTQRTFAQGIAGAGLAILYLAAYAAFGFYHLAPQAIAFAFLVSTTGLGFALSLRHDSPAIAALGLLGGYLTPLLLSTGEDHPWFLLPYVLLMDFAAMALKRRKGWRVLEVLSFAATTVIYLAWFVQHESAHRKTAVATLGALAYYALYAYAGSRILAALSSFVGALEILFIWSGAAGPFFAFELLIAASGMFLARARRIPAALTLSFVSFWFAVAIFSLDNTGASIGARFTGISLGFLLLFVFTAFNKDVASESRTASTTVLTTFAANGPVYFGVAYTLLRSNHHQWLGLIAVCVAAIYLAWAALARKRFALEKDSDVKPLLLSIGMALAFITLAIPIQLSGFRITVAWALQAAALTWLGAKFQSQRAYIGGAVVFVLVAARLVISDAWLYMYTSSAPTVLVNPRFFAFAVSAACAFVAAKWIVSSSRKLALAEYFGAHLTLLAGLTLEVLLWVGKIADVSNRLSAQTFSVSVLYGVYALALVGAGVINRTAVNRLSGLVLIGFVIVKLYLFDVWQLDRIYRIAAFVALGVLLISTSFLYSRYRHVLESLLRNDETVG